MSCHFWNVDLKRLRYIKEVIRNETFKDLDEFKKWIVFFFYQEKVSDQFLTQFRNFSSCILY